LFDSALDPAPAPKEKRQIHASDPAHSKQPGLPPAPAPAAAPVSAQKRQNTADFFGESDEEYELVVLPSAMPAKRTAVVVGLLQQASNKMQQQPSKRVLVPAHVVNLLAPSVSKRPAPKLDSVTSTVTATTAPPFAPRSTPVLRVVFEVDWISVGHGHTVSAKLPLVKNDWLRMEPEDKVKRIEGLWTKSTTKLGSYSSSWDKGVKLFTSDGFGEVTASFCLFMVEIHAKHNAFPIHGQTFIDIGSGLAKAVCQVATLQPNFKSCFGIELQRDRSCHSTEITASFAKNALRALVPFCQISLVQGDCLQNHILRRKLSRAGLIFINNEIFSIKLNQVKMTFTLTP
jgi:hypothetical protein